MPGVKSALAGSVSAVAVIASAGIDVGTSFSDSVSQGTPAGVTTLAMIGVSLSEDEVGVIAVGASLSSCDMVGETISLVPVGIIVVAVVASVRLSVSVGTALVEPGETTASASWLTISFGGGSDSESLTSSSAL